MKNRRRIRSREFKARIALGALNGLKTVQQVAAENEVHPTQVTQWKSQMIEGASEVFEQGRRRASQEHRSGLSPVSFTFESTGVMGADEV